MQWTIIAGLLNALLVLGVFTRLNDASYNRGRSTTTTSERARAIGCSCASESQAPAGYEHLPGLGYYKVHTFGASWCMANQICLEEGAQLLVLNSEMEAEAMKILIAKHPTITGAENSHWLWIGIHEKGTNGDYFTVNGDPLHSTGFTRWAPHNPNDDGPNECGLINRETGGLGDHSCAASWGFICEIPEHREHSHD